MVLAVDDVNDFRSAAQDERLHRDGKYVLDVPELQLGVRVHPGIDRQIFIGNVDLRFHGPGFEIYAASEANNFSCKRTAQGIHANLQFIANLDVFHRVFRHRHAQTQQTTFGELYDRQRLIVGIPARLNQRSGIRIAPGDDSIQGSDDLRISLYRPDPVTIGDSHLRGPPRRRQRCFCCVHLGGCGKILRLGVIQLLLGDQAGLGFRRLLHTSVVRVQGSIFSLRPGHIVLGANDLVLPLAHLRQRSPPTAPAIQELRGRQASVLPGPCPRYPRRCA